MPALLKEHIQDADRWCRGGKLGLHAVQNPVSCKILRGGMVLSLPVWLAAIFLVVFLAVFQGLNSVFAFLFAELA